MRGTKIAQDFSCCSTENRMSNTSLHEGATLRVNTEKSTDRKMNFSVNPIFDNLVGLR